MAVGLQPAQETVQNLHLARMLDDAFICGRVLRSYRERRCQSTNVAARTSIVGFASANRLSEQVWVASDLPQLHELVLKTSLELIVAMYTW